MCANNSVMGGFDRKKIGERIIGGRRRDVKQKIRRVAGYRLMFVFG